MSSYNKVTLMGRLTRDPEIRFTAKGAAIASLSLAVNRQWTDANGEKKEEVSFIDCTAFGKQAKVIAQYRKKGEELMLDGRLKLDTWEDKQTNQKRSKLGVIIESFQLIGRQDTTAKPAATEQPAAPGSEPAPNAEERDSVPF